MSRGWLVAGFLSVGLLVGASVASAADDKDPLVRARLFYNMGQFDAAIASAEQARSTPGRADSADLIVARACLERFRQKAAPADLSGARDRLRRLNASRFVSTERLEYIVGLGEALYLEEAFGAAGDIFGSVIVHPELLSLDAREHVFDWWATALDREARVRPEPDRQAAYQRIRERMQAELSDRPGSTAAAYWLSAAALGQGDWQAALSAAQAGWLRAGLSPNGGATLREDLDRLVLKGILGERRSTVQVQETLRSDWEKFKERWKHD